MTYNETQYTAQAINTTFSSCHVISWNIILMLQSFHKSLFGSVHNVYHKGILIDDINDLKPLVADGIIPDSLNGSMLFSLSVHHDLFSFLPKLRSLVAVIVVGYSLCCLIGVFFNLMWYWLTTPSAVRSSCLLCGDWLPSSSSNAVWLSVFPTGATGDPEGCPELWTSSFHAHCR